MSKKNSLNKDESSELPESVTLASHYAFFDDDGNLLQWQEGFVVTDPDHVELLVERGAPLKEAFYE